MRHIIPMTKHVSKLLGALIALVVVLLLIALLPLISGPKATAQQTDLEVLQAHAIPQSKEQIGLSFAPLVKQASPAVVNIYTTRIVQQQRLPWPFSDSRMRAPTTRNQSSLGSGVIVAPDGVVVTNNHVINGADEIRVVLSDRREYDAEIVLADERTDLAVLKIDVGDEQLPILTYANTRSVEVGDLVLAIGNPFGVGQTVTSGIISATARTDVGVNDFAFFLQTDAAINPGNSGGALINNQGELVGVNTAIFSRSGGSNGIGFAIPAEMVRRVVDAGVNEGRIVRPWLGLKGQSVTFDIARTQGLDRPVGIMITDIFDDGPADKAGLRRGDIVTAIDGLEVFDDGGLRYLAATQAPGDYVTLSTLRSRQEREVEVKLTPPPGATEAELVLLEGVHPLSGAEIAVLSPALADNMGRDVFSDTGVLVTRTLRRSSAQSAQIRPGDMVLAINDVNIDDLDDLERALDTSDSEWTYLLRRNGRDIIGQCIVSQGCARLRYAR
ncbi:MAG: Do family serine endopeptidase [Pseudomonadota bacterium]